MLSFAAGFTAKAQVGINTTTPHASAALDIVSEDKGVLVPRLTLAQRSNISAPANGLLIYQTDSMPGFYYYTGTAWQQLASGSGAYVDLITDQTIGGNKRFISEITVSGVKVGKGPGTNNNENTRVGLDALQWNTSGYFNTAYGYLTLNSNTTGGLNSANGAFAQGQNTTGYYTTANGAFALYENITGGENTAVGVFALQKSNGTQNTAVAENKFLNGELPFVNLKKSEVDFLPPTMYDEYAINEFLFRWQSQNQTANT